MRVTTASGTVYAFEGDRVRRESGDPLRRDGEWLQYAMSGTPTVGEPMSMFLIGLRDGHVTLRTTTPVTEVAE